MLSSFFHADYRPDRETITMCGFAGFFTPNNNTSSDTMALRAKIMASAIYHRGPDSHGIWVDSQCGIALGHRRLAIIDTSEGGHQPMQSASGRYMLVFNGEIYNYKTLRKELSQKGAHFTSQSDTEVILAAFEAWGIKSSLERFNGMFALALWDHKNQELILARDRMGQKPLFAGWYKNTFFFGSELKALKAHPEFTPEINQKVIPLYTTFGNIPAPFSIFKDIFKIKPGCLHRINHKKDKNWHEKSEKYDKTIEKSLESLKKNEKWTKDDAINTLQSHLNNAVSRRMVSDVPLGAFLSGGVDSSLIVSTMQKLSPKPVRSFTIGFHEKDFDEAPYAKAIANHLGTDHTELYVSEKDARDTVPHMARLCDEPFADSSIIPTALVSQLARRHVTVALSGDGGDELFMGYRRHFIPAALRHHIPAFMNKPLGLLLKHTPARTFRTALHLLHPEMRTDDITDSRLQAMASLLRGVPANHYYEQLLNWGGSDNHFLYKSKPDINFSKSDVNSTLLVGLPPETQIALLDLLLYLPNDIHMKADRASMAHSLELRAPFMDPDMVSFALSLPVSMKIQDKKGKWLLRQALGKHLPENLYERPKAGFAIPLNKWLRHDLKDWAHETMAHVIGHSSDLGMDGTALRQNFEAYQKGKNNNAHLVWGLCMLGQWHAENN